MAAPAQTRFNGTTVLEAVLKGVADLKAVHTFESEHGINGQIVVLTNSYGIASLSVWGEDELHLNVQVPNNTGAKFPNGEIRGNTTIFKKLVLFGPNDLDVAINNIVNILTVAKEDANV